jgi:nicotinamide-nucleotide amidase
MHAEILSIGDEIVSGRLLDTNAPWLSLRLEELGIPVLHHASVGDSLEAMVDAFRTAIERSDLVVSTGGLGPTADDLTRDALASLTGRRLRRDEASLAHIRGLFARRNRPMPARNEVQAMFPEGSRVIFNPHGTAPGIDLDVPRDGRPATRWFALPGVPAEMVEMWEGTLRESLRVSSGCRRQIRHRVLKCFGAGESQIESMLPDLIRRGRHPRVGINAAQATILLRITASGDDEAACRAAMEPTVATIRQCLGPLVYGEGDEELQDVVADLLARRGDTLATVEWGTAGLVAEWLGNAAGAAGRYVGGLVVGDRATAQRVLDLAFPGGHSPEEVVGADDVATLVEAMATACRGWFASDHALAVGPFSPDDAGAARPLVLAVASDAGVRVRECPIGFHPAIRRALAGKFGLDFVRRVLLDLNEVA